MHNFDLLLVLLHVSESEVTLTSSDTEDHIFLCFALVHNLQLVICLVVSANALSIGKVGFSATSGSKIPEGIATKLGVSNYVGDPTSTSKYGSEGSAWGVSPYVWNITVCDFPFCFFLLFVFSSHLQVARVDWFSRSIHQMAHFLTKKCLLGVSMINFHISTFIPRIWKLALRPMATSNGDNSGIFKDRSKMFVPKVRFSGSVNFCCFRSSAYTF